MKKDQLFKKNPSNELFEKILNSFGLNGLDDSTEFSKVDMIKMSVIDELDGLIPEFIFIYLPCKYTFLDNINLNRAITILRQLVKCYGYNVKIRQVVINKVKHIYYRVVSNTRSSIVIKKNVTIRF